MIGLIAFALGAAVGAMKARWQLVGATAAAAALWTLLFGPLDGELPGGLTFLLALLLAGVPLMTAFAEASDSSPWERRRGDDIATFVFTSVGVTIMLGLTAAIAIGYVSEGTLGGVLVMGLWAALLVRTFVPLAWDARPRR